MLTDAFVFLCRFPIIKKLIWARWYQFLARSPWEPSWTFMNYGYAPTSLKLRPEDEPSRYFIQLYHEVAAIDLTGKQVLEVGSGRGGGASYLKRYLGPSRVMGVDYSANAVQLSRRTHRVGGLTFATGDAEALPFPDSSFDAVVNVESSHCYRSVDAFFGEVRRVLRPGGHFLYADMRDRDSLRSWRGHLERTGMKILRDIDITSNVVAALDQEDDRKRGLIAKMVAPALRPVFSDFAGLRGSQVYQGFQNGAMIYRAFTLQKELK